MNKNLKNQDVLLVKEKKRDELKVVAGINPDTGKEERDTLAGLFYCKLIVCMVADI